eukprot:g5394.t1
MTESSYIPQADASQDPICTGPALWYALDATTSTSMNTVAKKKASQIYLLQTNSSELYFGMLNGKSSANGGSAVASLRLSFSDINVANTNVKWQVQNDPTAPANLGKSFDACFQGDANSGGCYRWDTTIKTGNSKWRWDDSKTSGGVLGPLPSYNFCAKLKRDDIRGIDSFEFVDATYDGSYSKPVAFHPEAFDYFLKVCTYNCEEGPPLIITPGDSDSGSDNPTSGSQTGSQSASGSDDGSSGSTGDENGENGNGNSDSINGAGGSGSTSQSGSGDTDISGSDEAMGDSSDDKLPIGIIAGASAGCCLLTVFAVVFLRKRKQKYNQMKKSQKLPPGWVEFLDEVSGHPCYMNEETGETQWEHPGYGKDVEMSAFENPMRENGLGDSQKPNHGRNVTQLPAGWSGEYTEEGDKYYVNEQSGDSSWEAPPGSKGGSTGIPIDDDTTTGNHGRTQTQLPAGWSGEYTEAGEKYYVDENSGETSWDAPPGSTGGSTGILVGSQVDNPSRVRRTTVGIVDGSKYYEDEDGNTTWDKEATN